MENNKNNKTKYILRKALERLGGSNELGNRKKMGFNKKLYSSLFL